jgi:hypothetical protein
MAERLQIKMEFDASEDRLLLRISERKSKKSCVEYRFWLTRRFVNIFMKAADKLIEDELAGDMLVSPDALGPMKKFQHEAALSKADFSTSFGAGDGDCSLFGEKPVLVSTLKITKKGKGKYILSLLDNENVGIHLTASMNLIHSLQKMLLDSAHNAAWNRPLFQTKEEEPELIEPSGYIS